MVALPLHTLIEVVAHGEVQHVPLRELVPGDVLRGVYEDSVVHAVRACKTHWHQQMYRYFALGLVNGAQRVHFCDRWYPVHALVDAPTYEYCAPMGELTLCKGHSCVADGVGIAVTNVHTLRAFLVMAETFGAAF